MDIHGTKVSLAQMMFTVLSNPKRKFQYKDHEQKVTERRYHLRPVEDASTHNVKMTAVGFEKKKGRYGIGCHYCFVGDPLLGLKLGTWFSSVAVTNAEINSRTPILPQDIVVHLITASIGPYLRSMTRKGGMTRG